MKLQKAFTLIELIIGVTISALIMLSLLVFTGDSIRSAKYNKQLITNQNENFSFEKELVTNLDKVSSWWIIYSWTIAGHTWFFLETKDYSNLITFFWTKTFTWLCDYLSWIANESWIVDKIVIKSLNLPSFQSGYLNYSIKWNQIFSWSNVLMWAEWWWNNFSTWAFSVEMNNPSAIVWTGKYLFIADTGNSRILGFDVLSKKVINLLDSNNWINRPTDLYLTWSRLYIVNTWWWNILVYEDENSWTWSQLDIKFKVNTGYTNVNIINFNFPSNTNFINSLTWSDFTFSWFSLGSNDIVSTWTGFISYAFSGMQSFSTWNQYWVTINNISSAPTNIWSHYVEMSFSWSTYKEYFPYFTKSDNNITTSTGNELKVWSWWFKMPNSIINENSWSWEITDFTWLLNSNTGEIISFMPVKNFEYNLSWSLLTLKFLYYKYYDCINWKHILKERILKKYIK